MERFQKRDVEPSLRWGDRLCPGKGGLWVQKTRNQRTDLEGEVRNITFLGKRGKGFLFSGGKESVHTSPRTNKTGKAARGEKKSGEGFSRSLGE